MNAKNPSHTDPLDTDTSVVDDFDLGFNQTPEQLIGWLDAKYARHGEDEDRQAAELLRKLVAQAPANDERAIVAAAKVQAKRLLKLAKKEPLKITALNEALGVVAQLHGYPHWQAMSASAPSLPVPAARPANAILESLTPIQGKGASVDVGMPAGDSSDGRDLRGSPVTTADNTAGRFGAVDGRMETYGTTPVMGRQPNQPEVFSKDSATGLHRHTLNAWAQTMASRQGHINVFTPHIDALDSEKVRKVMMQELLELNPILTPMGSKAMLPSQLDLLVTVLLSIKGYEEDQGLRLFLTRTIEQSLTKHFETYSDTINEVQHTSRRMLTEGMITKEAHELLAIETPWSFFSASVVLMLEGFYEAAWLFHNENPFTLLDLQGELSKDKNTKDPYHMAARECLNAWCVPLYGKQGQRGSKPLTLTTRNIVAFEVDAGALDTELPATTRWLLATLMGHYTRTNVWVTEYTKTLSHSAYEQHNVAIWAQSIAREQRDQVVSWHTEKARELMNGPNIDLFDEMDGPLNSPTVTASLIALTRREQQMGIGTWLLFEKQSCPPRLEAMFAYGSGACGPLEIPA